MSAALTQPDIYLSVIIPGLNQGDLLAHTLENVKAHTESFDFATEVIYVDGNSSDTTADIVNDYRDRIDNFRSLFDTDLAPGPDFTGKGAGVKTGMLAARGRLRMYLDADSSTPFSEVDKLLHCLEAGYQVALGSRYIDHPQTGRGSVLAFARSFREVAELLVTGKTVSNFSREKQAWLRQFMSRGGNLAFATILGIDVADSRCGFKAYTREAAETIFSRTRIPGFGFEEETLILAKINHFKTIEIPVKWYDRSGNTNVSPLRDSCKSFAEIARVKWSQLRGRYRQPPPAVLRHPRPDNELGGQQSQES